ncbi:hypothetical protein ACNS7O_03400 [Haloferacaceae archaeon DSL9]
MEKIGCAFTATGLILISAILLAWPTDDVAYHNTIFEAYPQGFSYLLYGTLILCIIVLASGTYYNRTKTISTGGLLYLLWMGLFYILHYSRGYIFGSPSSDSVYHMGVIKTILGSGRLVETEIYPASHALISIVAALSDASSQSIVIVLAFTFRVGFLLGIVLIGRRLWGQKGLAAVLVAATPFIFGHFIRTMHPFFYAFSLIPIILFVYDKSLIDNTARFQVRRAVILLLLIGSLVLLHPMTAIYFLAICLSWSIGYAISNRRSPSVAIRPVNAFPAICAVFVAIWITFHSVLLNSTIGVVISNIVSESNETGPSDSGESILNVFLTSFDQSPASAGALLYEVVIVEYGAALIYAGLGGLVVFWIAYRVCIKKANFSEVVITSVYVIGCLIGAGFLIIYVIAANPIRVGLIGLLSAIFLVGFVLNHASENNKKVVYMVLVCTLTVTAIISGGMVYSPNSHMQPTTVDGVEWSYNHQIPETPSETNFDRKLSYYTLGYSGVLSNATAVNQFHNTTLPRNIGYEEYDTVGDRLETPTYIILTERDISRHKAYSEERWPGFQWLIEEDNRDHLNSDPHASRIYSSSQYDVWLAKNSSTE